MFPGSCNKSTKRPVGFINDEINTSNNIEEDEKPKNYYVDESENKEFEKYMKEMVDNENIIEKSIGEDCFFSYKALDFLEKDLPDFTENEKVNVHICAFNVNKDTNIPFLQFVMNKFPPHFFEDLLSFPCFTTHFEKKSFLDSCISKLDELLILHKGKNDYKYEGYFMDNGEFYVLFDISDINMQAQELYRNDKMWLVLIDEIINYESVCNFKIYSQTLNFFKKYKEFCFLYDNQEKRIETPIVCYSGVDVKKIKMASVFGIQKAENNAIVGPFYYFTSYEKSIESAAWSKPPYPTFDSSENEVITKREKGGIVRFAIFLGSLKVPLNSLNDCLDDSACKKYLLKKNEDYLERQTTRITDYDGEWIKEYDSVYIGKVELDDGKKFVDAPYWVVKEHRQQVPVSFHYVNKETLGETWNENDKYFLL
jgi:hypothetical protein